MSTRSHVVYRNLVPLSIQAVTILRELQPLTGRFPFAFPSVYSRYRPMSENAITGALRRMGYNGQYMTGHGFRSMASTLLNEQGWNRDAIERPTITPSIYPSGAA
jgi:integrase